MSILRRLTSVSSIQRLRQSQSRLSTTLERIPGNFEQYVRMNRRVLIGKYCVVVGGLVLSGVCMCYFTWEESEMKHQVYSRFKKGCCPKGFREDDYIQRDVQDEITAAFCGKEDTDGMFGIVFGAAGTGKSNVLRHICKERYDQSQLNPKKPAGVLYVELGSDARFSHKLAEICGIPLEPNIIEVAIAKIFPSWKRHLTLSLDNTKTALAEVFSVIEEGGLLYKKKEKKVPVLIIDGADIIAKNDMELFFGLLEWAKKCANEDTVLVVMGSSDGHVLRTVDKHSCKSRAAPLVEVEDFPKFNDLKDLFDRRGVPREVAEYLFNEITGGRLTDTYKAISLYKKFVKEAETQIIKEKIKHVFESEIKQALLKVMDDPSNVLQLEIAAAVVDRNLPHAGNTTLSVPELAMELVHHGIAKHIHEVTDSVNAFVDHNILRYNANRELVAHSKMAGKVLEELVTSRGIQQRRCWQKPWYKRLRGDEHSNECLLNASNSSSQKEAN